MKGVAIAATNAGDVLCISSKGCTSDGAGNSDDVIFGKNQLKVLASVVACYACYHLVKRMANLINKWKHRYVLLEALPTLDPTSLWLYHLKDFLVCSKLKDRKDEHKKELKTVFTLFSTMCEELCYRKGHGGFRLSIFSPSMLPFLSGSLFVVVDYKLVQQVVHHPDLQAKGSSYDDSKALVDHSILIATGHDWKRMRKLTSKAFSNSILNNVHDTAIKILQEKIFPYLDQKQLTNNPYVNLVDLFGKLTLDVLGITSFSYNFGGVDSFISLETNNSTEGDSQIKDSEIPVCQLFQEIKEDIVTSARCIFYKPPRLRKNTCKIDGIISSIIEKRLRQQHTNDNNDLLDYLCEKDTEGLPILTGKEILGNIKTFTFAGHDTLKTTMSVMFFELGRRPDLIKKLREEIDPMFDGGCNPSYNELRASCKYVNKVIREVLRFYAPGLFSRKSPTKDVVLETSKYKYILPKGIEIMMSPCLTHRYHRNDNTLNEEGEDGRKSEKMDNGKQQTFNIFDPDRIIDHIDPFFPFALGARNCVGREMAMAELRVVLVQYVYNYDLILRPEDEERGLDLDIDLTIEVGYYGMELVKRTQNKALSSITRDKKKQ